MDEAERARGKVWDALVLLRFIIYGLLRDRRKLALGCGHWTFALASSADAVNNFAVEAEEPGSGQRRTSTTFHTRDSVPRKVSETECSYSKADFTLARSDEGSWTNKGPAVEAASQMSVPVRMPVGLKPSPPEPRSKPQP